VHVGHYISGVVHAGFVGWMLLGSVLSERPEDLIITAVDVVTPAEFEALSGTETPDTKPVITKVSPVPPQQFDAPSLPDTALTDPVPPRVSNQPRLTARSESSVVRADLSKPQPSDRDPLPIIPDLVAPEPTVVAQLPDSIAPVPETGEGTPEFNPISVPRAAPRVAPQAAPEPVLDVAIAPVEQAAPARDAQSSVPLKDEEPTQTAEATTRVTPDAQVNASGAVGASLRPRARRASQVADTPAVVSLETVSDAPTVPEVSEIAPTDSGLDVAGIQDPQDNVVADDAVSAALLEVLADIGTQIQASGPPMTVSETEALRRAIQNCWVVDPGSGASLVTVTIAFSLTQDGTLRGSSLRLVGNSDGSKASIDAAFQTASRAVRRCETELGGYDLPPEKYAYWKDIEITFDPQQMRLR
jgi:hypothetical protein